jgi:hypothetical protein
MGIFSKPKGLYADKDEYTSKELIFDVTKIEFGRGTGYQGQDEWLCTLAVAGREPEVMSFGRNPKRDALMKQAHEQLVTGEPIRNITLRKSGNAYYFNEVEGADLQDGLPFGDDEIPF